jgi:hypothetical protein
MREAVDAAAGGQQRRAEQAGLEEGSAGCLHTLAFVFCSVRETLGVNASIVRGNGLFGSHLN